MPYVSWGFPRLGSRTGANVCYDLQGVRSRVIAVQYALNLNVLSTDTVVSLVPVPGGYTGTATWILRGVLFTNATASLGTSPTVSLYTGAGGTGSTLVSAQSLSALTSANLYVDGTLTATATSTLINAAAYTTTPNTLYLRTGASNALVATVDVYLLGEVLF